MIRPFTLTFWLRLRYFLLLPLLVLAGCESITETPEEQQLGASLTPAAVKPTAPEGSTGSGSMTGTLSTIGGKAEFEYVLTFAELDGVTNGVHLHGPASADNVGGLLVDLENLPAGSTGTMTAGDRAGSGSGTLDLTLPITATVSGDSLHKLLSAGLVYVDVHTVTNPNGEIRGQIVRQ